MKTAEISNLDMLSPDNLEHIRSSKQVRMGIAKQSLIGFMHLYFPEYITRPTAPFHHEMYGLLEDEVIDHLVLMAFRGSGKSTIVTLGYPIWAALGALSKKFILIASQTQPQAQQHLKNIKREFESNELLRKDFGPLNEIADEWGSVSLVLPKFDARVTAVSVEQSIRGVRHGPHRPDLIIADDVEDTNSVKTREGRNKVWEWYTGEVVPAGDTNTKRVVVGNLLHEDSLLMRLKEAFELRLMQGIFRSYPVVKQGQPLWRGKYPDKEALRREELRVGNRVAWHREYLLEILPNEDQVVHRGWLRYYDELPERNHDHPDNTLRYYNTYLGIDLAISQKDTADYTAMVAVHVFGFQESLKVYVDPLIINKRLTHLQTLETIAQVVETLGDKYKVDIIVEDVGYQSSVIEQLQNKNYRVEPFKVLGADKRARFISVSHLFEFGRVYLPRSSGKELANQLTGFGVEKHDDLVDAIVMTLGKVVSKDKPVGSYNRVVVGKHSLWKDFDDFENGRGRWSLGRFDQQW